jgi:hypothetical protein
VTAPTDGKANAQYAELVAAVHRGCEGLDSWQAHCIVVTVTSTLRRQIAADLRGMCERHGVPCRADGGCHHDVATSIAMGGRRPCASS